MIEQASWQHVLADSTKTWQSICERLELPADAFALKAHGLFSMRVTERYLEKIIPGDAQDPLLKQILPITQETLKTPGFSPTPLKEDEYNPLPGLLHKYHGRVLVMFSSACAIHCRYCFRRNFAYEDNTPGRPGLEKILNYIRESTDIHEVILSGGDPLTTPDPLLAFFVAQLEKIAHVKVLRIHSRLPIVLPERLNDTLLQWFCGSRLKPVLVIHCNHANELDNDIADALSTLQQKGVTLLNQSVLLNGVNDNVEVLAQLSHRLFSMGVLPYYLHLLDPVEGASHFAVDLIQAQAIMRKLATQLPGYLLPKLVREIPGQANKTWQYW